MEIADHDYAQGLAVKMPIEEYHKHPAISKSGLDLINRSPAHFRYAQLNAREQTPAMRIGSLTHDSILQPELFASNTLMLPELDRRTKAGRECYADFLATAKGQIVVSKAEHQQIKAMTEAAHSHPTASKLLARSHNELSFFVKDGKTGMDVRCRPDALREHHMVVDLKTTGNGSFRDFQKSVGNYRYAVQAAFYLDILSLVTGNKYDTFILIAVEKDPPFAVATYILDDASIEAGRALYQRDLAVYAKCIKDNHWPAYSSELVPMNLPHWAFPSTEDL